MVAIAAIALQPAGDEDSSKRRQILDGARRVFMDLGFDGKQRSTTSDQTVGNFPGGIRGITHLPFGNRDTAARQKFFGLIFVDIHGIN